MEIKDRAFEDWQAGMKYKQIAEKYGVSVNTVKSWAVRDFKERNTATSMGKELQPKATRLQPKKRGAPPGNANAMGNHGGAPVGNQNALKHGAYARFMTEYMEADEREVFQDTPQDDALDILKQELALLNAQEVRLHRRIRDLKAIKGGLSIEEITSRQLVTVNGEFEEGENGKLVKRKGTGFYDGSKQNETVTNTVSTYDLVQKLEEQLIRVQGKKIKVIESIERISITREKLELERRRADSESEQSKLASAWMEGLMELETEETEDGEQDNERA